MITRVRIKNYRSIEDVDVQLGALTVLVGRNGSGKSTFLDALKFVRDALRVGLENAVISRGGIGSIQRWTPRGDADIEISLEVHSPNVEGRYSFQLRRHQQNVEVAHEEAEIKSRNYPYREGKPYPSDEEWTKSGRKGIRVPEFSVDYFSRKGEHWESLPDDFIMEKVEHEATPFERTDYVVVHHPLDVRDLVLQSIRIPTIFGYLADELEGSFYSIFPNTLRLPQKPLIERILNDNGENFVSILQQVTKDPNLKAGILASLSQAVEGVDDIRVTHAGGFLVGELHHIDLEHHGEAPWFDLSQESDGTLRMLGLLTALYQNAEGNPLLAVEEPELALYPWALSILADEFKATSFKRQIIITTQSPDLISSFDPTDLRIVVRKDGKTRIAPLDKVQVGIISDELFSGGDLLRIEGLRGEGLNDG